MRLLVLIFLVGTYCLYAQEKADKVRLVYDSKKTDAQQLAFSVSGDGRFIALAYDDATLKIMDSQLSRFIHQSQLSFDDLFDIRFIDNASLLAVSANTAQVLDRKSGNTIAHLSMPDDITYSEISKSGKLVAIGDKKGNVLIWDFVRRRDVIRFRPFQTDITSLAFHPKGEQLLISNTTSSMGKRAQISIFDVNTGRLIKEIDKMYLIGFAGFTSSGDKVFYQGQQSAPKFLYDAYFQKTTLKVYDMNLGKQVSKAKVGFSLGANLFLNGVIYENKFIGVTAQNSFEVRDLYSGEQLFTTLRDKSKKFARKQRTTRIYPLAQPGFYLLNYQQVGSTQWNMNLIFDANQLKIVGYLYSDSDDEYAIVSRDGRSYGTENAFQNVFWSSHRSSKKVSLESTADIGFTPKLFTQLVDNTGKQDEFEVDDYIGEMPELFLKSINGESVKSVADTVIQEFKTRFKKATVTIGVRNNPGNIESMKLYNNTKLVGSLENNKEKPLSQYVFDLTLTNSFGNENYIYAYAKAASGLNSEKIKIIVHYEGETDANPEMHIFTIGINQYKNQRYNLNYAVADANAIETAIQEGASGIFKKINLYRLRDTEASRATILNKLNEISLKAREQDLFIFYYAGHGSMAGGKEEESEFYLIPYDITQIYGRDDLLRENGISASDIQSASEKINAQKQVFVLDACQSAGLLETVATRGVAEERAIAQLARSTGTFWITSTGSEQFASEFESLGHGLFTYSLLEGLEGLADGGLRDNKITIRELITYVEDRVPVLSEEYKGAAQYPSTFSFGNDFPVVTVEGDTE